MRFELCNKWNLETKYHPFVCYYTSSIFICTPEKSSRRVIFQRKYSSVLILIAWLWLSIGSKIQKIEKLDTWEYWKVFAKDDRVMFTYIRIQSHMKTQLEALSNNNFHFLHSCSISCVSGTVGFSRILPIDLSTASVRENFLSSFEVVKVVKVSLQTYSTTVSDVFVQCRNFIFFEI